ncbi:putative DUF3328 domain protein [Seiridium cardinale]
MSSPFLKSLGLAWLLRNDRKDYQSLRPDEKSEPDGGSDSAQADDRFSDRTPRPRLSILLQLSVVILTLALIIVSSLHLELIARTTSPPRLDCGTSIEEALEKGCKFDQLMKTWLPAECPRVGLKEHITAGYTAGNDTGSQWRYYKDRERNEEVPVEKLGEMAEVDQNFFATGREHMSHCAWMLTRMAHVHTHPGMRKDFLVSNFEHTKHCIFFLVQFASSRSGQELLAYIESLPVIAQSRHGNVNTEFVRRPIEKPEAYFRAADVINHIPGPYYPCLKASTLLTVQLDSNYLTFTDKFVSLLDQLELIFPIFDRQWMTAALKHLITSRRAFIICMEIF